MIARTSRPSAAPGELDPTKPYVVRYLNCTTNKPLHLGHFRNIVLGDATAGVLAALGIHVVRHCILEDTGRFMTEAMAALASLERAGEPLPEPGPRSDHFVGIAYAAFRKARAAGAAKRRDSPAPKVASGAPVWGGLVGGAARRDGRDGDALGDRPTGAVVEAPHEEEPSPARAGKGAAMASTSYEARNDDADELMRALLRDDEPALRLRDRVRRMAMTGQEATLRRLGVVFDCCDFESAEDPRMGSFIRRCRARGLAAPTMKGGLGWSATERCTLPLVNAAGLYEESARLLSFHTRTLGTRAGDYTTIVIAGSEWTRSFSLYPEFLDRLVGFDGSRYVSAFYGMVNLDGKKMSSSAETGILIDHLLDSMSADDRLGRFAAQSGGALDVDALAVLVCRSLFLSVDRMRTLEFTPATLHDPGTNPGWTIAAAVADYPEPRSGLASPASRALLREAAERRSFETALGRATEIAARVVAGTHEEAEIDDLHAMVAALSLLPRRRDFAFDSIGSFLQVC